MGEPMVCECARRATIRHDPSDFQFEPPRPSPVGPQPEFAFDGVNGNRTAGVQAP